MPFPKSAELVHYSAEVAKKLGGLPEIQEQNATFVIEKGSQVILALTQLRMVEKIEEEVVTGHLHH